MTKQTPIFDVFLSHNSRDEGLASFVRDSLTSKGLSVFSMAEVTSATPIGKVVREGLVDSIAVVLLLTPSSNSSRYMAFEAGMAMAWSKPIFVLHDGVVVSEIPDFLREFPTFPVQQTEEVAQKILSSQQTLKPEHADLIKGIYSDTGVPADQLLLEPSVLKEMSDQFYAQSGLRLTAPRIAHELVRMRKSGQLPRPKRLAHSS